jgi:hypothetical protein
MLELLPDEPAEPPKKKPATAKKKTAPKPAQSASPFDFAASKPATLKPPEKKKTAPKPKSAQGQSSLDFTSTSQTGPASDFSFAGSAKKTGVAVQLRASSAASFMRFGVIFAVVPTMAQVGLPITFAVQREEYALLGVACCPLSMFLFTAIFVFLGARALDRMSSFAMAILGANVSLLLGLASLGVVVLLIVAVVGIVVNGMWNPMASFAAVTALVTYIQSMLSLWGGIRGIFVSLNGDVRAAMAAKK